MITPNDKKLLQFLAKMGPQYVGDFEDAGNAEGSSENQLKRLERNWLVDRYRDNDGYAIVSITETGHMWLKAQEDES